MREFHRIHFEYYPAEADIPVVTWFLASLSEKLEQHQARLIISDMKFGRSGLDVSWYLEGNVSESFESELEEGFEWICLKATKYL